MKFMIKKIILQKTLQFNVGYTNYKLTEMNTDRVKKSLSQT